MQQISNLEERLSIVFDQWTLTCDGWPETGYIYDF